MSELVKYSEQTFESIKHINEYGEEYWLARELQPVLEYVQWRNFAEAVERAKLACKTVGFPLRIILLMSAKCQKTYTPFVVFRNYRLKKSKKPIISFAISE